MKNRFSFERFSKTLISILWLLGIILAYYVMHKPISPQIAFGLFRNFCNLLVAILLLLVAAGIGRKILNKLSLPSLLSITIEASLGIGILYFFILLAGYLHVYHAIFLGSGLLFLLTVLRKNIITWLYEWRSLIHSLDKFNFTGCLLCLGISLIFLSGFLVAISPPVKFDALVYHLALPQAYRIGGGFDYVPSNIFWGMPQIGELLYTVAMVLAGKPAALLTGFFVGLLACLGIFGWIREYFSSQVALVGVVSLLGGFSLADSLSWGYIDWLTILFGLSTLVMFDVWRKTRQRNFLLLAGIFTAFAMGTKYSAGVILFCGLFIIIFTSFRDEPLRKIAQSCFLYFLVVILFFSPWLIKNFIATGNPVYPLLFPAGAMTDLRLARYQGGKPWGGWQDTIFLPIRSTIFGVEESTGYSASIGPLLLGLGLLFWLGWREMNRSQRGIIRLAGITALAGLFVWMIAGRFSSYLLQSRLYFVIFPAFAVLASAGYVGFQKITFSGVRLSRIVNALVLLVFGLNVFQVCIDTLKSGALQVAFALEDEKTYLERNLGWYIPAMQAINDLPYGSKTLMLWEPRSLYCLPKCEPDEILDRWMVDRDREGSTDPKSSQEILAAWQQSGYTHLLYYHAGADFLKQESGFLDNEDWLVLDELLSGLPILEQFGDAYSLYHLNP